MKQILAAAAASLLWAGIPASAHRLDEYLQATTISIGKDRVEAQIRLTPGVAVFPIVLAAIDTDGDNFISASEQRAYALRVLRDLSLTVDGDPLPLRLISMKFGKTEDMKQGLGEIQLEVDAALPPGGSHRRLVLENHHQSRIAAYLVNCLVPREPGIRVTAQNRNYAQSYYELDYEQAAATWSSRAWLGLFALLMFARLAWLWRSRNRRHAERFRGKLSVPNQPRGVY